MRTVLHLIDQTTPRDMLRQMSLLAGPTDRVVSIGPPPDMPWFGRAVEHVHCPLGIGSLAGFRLAPLAAEAVVHAWSLPAGRAARSICKGRKFALSLPHLPPGSSLKPLVELLHGNACILTLPTEAACRTYCVTEAPSACVRQLPPPTIEIDDADGRRCRMRQALRVGDDDILLLGLGDMVRGGGHKYASWVHAILMQIKSHVRLLLPGHGPNDSHVRFFAGTTGYDKEVFLTGDRVTLDDCLAAADIALFLPQRDCGIWELSMAMRAAIPICASQTPDISECTGSGATVLLVPPAAPRLAAASAMKLIDQPEAARNLGRQARQFAIEHFSLQATQSTLQSIYLACIA